MNRKLLRVTLVGLVLIVALGALLPSLLSAVGVKISLGQTPVETSRTKYVNGVCSASSPGTTLVIDFGTSSKRALVARCAIGFGAKSTDTGWSLFTAAGIKVEGTTQYPTGFVCRVDNFPSQSDQPCTSTPTEAEGTWVYYSAADSGSSSGAWKFRMQGAAVTHPGCGTWEGWRFVTLTDKQTITTPRIEPKPQVCQY